MGWHPYLFVMNPYGRLDERLAVLNHEWDLDSAHRASLAVMAPATLILGLWGRGPFKKVALGLLGVQVGCLALRAASGWSPLAFLLRRLGFREEHDIDEERRHLIGRLPKPPVAKARTQREAFRARAKERRRLVQEERALERDDEQEPTLLMRELEELIPGATRDDLALEMGEEFVASVTSGEQSAEDVRNEEVPEDVGGPFVETHGRVEFAGGSDASNPEDGEQEAFPTTHS